MVPKVRKLLELVRLVTAEPEDRRAAIAGRLVSGSATNVPMLKAAFEGSADQLSDWLSNCLMLLPSLAPGATKITLTVAAWREEAKPSRRSMR